MERLIFIGILLFFQNLGNSCTFIPDSFCRTIDKSPNNVIISGIIINVDSTGIDIEVMETLRGEESRKIIRVWDGTDFECNGIWSMAASDIGDLNDTIIIVLPKITEIENDWDVIGDYRRPNPYTATPALLVKNENATGFISGDAIAPPEYNLWTIEYDYFKNIIIGDGDCSSLYLAIDETKVQSTFYVNNPFESHLYIQFYDIVKKGLLRLYSLNGLNYITREIKSKNYIELEVSDLPPGMYLLAVYTNENKEIIKIIKQNNR